MREFHDIVKSLLDKDGSCRDLNFEAPTWAGISELIRFLENTFREFSGTDQQGRSLDPPFRESAVAAAQNGGSAHLLFGQGTGPITHLQTFISPEQDGSPFIELTFFPADVSQSSALRSEFISWFQQVHSQLKSRQCYARYENASWRFGDISAGSGVFLVFNDVELDA